jgi:hypothetical protein
MGQHDGLGLGANGGFDLAGVNVVREGSTSTNTGTAPNCRMGLTVVGKPAATPMTSSPRLMARSPSLGEVRVLKATRLADEPELTVIRCLTPMKAASFFSNSALKRPVVSQPSRLASTMFLSSWAPMTLPEGGTTEAPGRNGCGAKAMAA